MTGRLMFRAREFLVREDGPTAVEYAVLLALIVLVCLTAIASLGTSTNKTFTTLNGSVQWSGSSSRPPNNPG